MTTKRSFCKVTDVTFQLKIEKVCEKLSIFFYSVSVRQRLNSTLFLAFLEPSAPPLSSCHTFFMKEYFSKYWLSQITDPHPISPLKHVVCMYFLTYYSNAGLKTTIFFSMSFYLQRWEV